MSTTDTQPCSDTDTVALVGMASRLPGGIATPEDLWDVLVRGDTVVTPADAQHPRSAILPAGILTDDAFTGFDHAHFILTAEEAAAVDPQQRWGLELTDEALQHAGIAPATLRGTATGVWWGSSCIDHALTRLGPHVDAEHMTMVDTAAALPSMVPGRISRSFDLRGPSALVDTACSASLVALHHARQALRLGEVDLAIVGGANALVLDTHTKMFRNSGTLSTTGRLRPFDQDADGFVRGEGAVVVVLQRLADAHAQGSPVRARILASATNNDGNSPGGVGAPSHRAQADLLRQVYAHAGIEADAVDYVQTHGTATPSGDNAERAALDAVLGRSRSPQRPLWLGSVKSTIGHLEGAAGLASVLAAVLALEHETIPPTAGHVSPMAQLRRDDTALQVPTEPVPWPAPTTEGNRVAGVGAAGFTATNAHILLAEPAPARVATAPSQHDAGVHLVPVSAAGPSQIRDTAGAWAQALYEIPVPLAEVAATAQHRRDHHSHRAVAVVSSTSEAAEAVDALAAGVPHPAVVGPRTAPRRPRVVFVYPGHGHHHAHMGRDLAAAEPVYAQALTQTQSALEPYLDQPPWTPDSNRALEGLHTIQPAGVAHQIALAALLAHWGITPDAVVGHSTGEVAAAHTAGILDLEETARLVAERSRLLQRATAHGAIAAVGLGAEQTQAALTSHPGLRLAAVNGPHSCVVAGPHADVEHLCQRLDAEGILTHLIEDAPPAHHRELLGEVADHLNQRLQNLAPHTGSVSMYSTATGERVDGPELDSGYWADQLLATVQLHPTIEDLARDEPCVFVVLGGRPVLAAELTDTLAATPTYDPSDPPVINCDSDVDDEHTAWLSALAEAHTHGIPITWPAPADRPACDLPARTWTRHKPDRAPQAPELQHSLAYAHDAGERRAAITAALSALIAPVMAARHGHTLDLAPDTDLTTSGLESLTIVALRHKITRLHPDLGDLPLTHLLIPGGATTLEQLTTALENHLTSRVTA